MSSASLLHVDADGLIHPLGGPSLPDDYSRALDGVAIGPDIGSCGSAAYYGKPVLAMDIDTDPRWQPLQGAAARGRPARLLVDADQGQGRPRDRNLRLLFQGMPRAEPLASAHRRRLRPSRCAGDRAQGSARPDRAARLLRHADRPAEPRAVAGADLRGDRGLSRRTATSRWYFSMSINFKDVNDTLGHSAGDELLVEFAQRLRAQIQPGDMLGRLGGDEFVIVLPNRDAARRLAGRLPDHRGAGVAAADRQPGRCRCPPAWASASIPTTPPTSIR